MNINLHIERLILDGLPIESRQGALVKKAIEAELSRLLEENGLSANLQSGGTMPNLQGGSMQINAGQTPAQIGQQIGQTIYGDIGSGGIKR